jgi:hypothetical protein
MNQLVRLIMCLSLLITMQGSFKIYAKSFDPMIHFAYPVSEVQAIRHQICQAVYAAQHNNYENAASLLENVRSLLSYRHNLSEDDQAYLQAMIDHLNHLISQLENESDRTKMVELLNDVQEQF